jgi:triphosphoribosyl-dephospho-CoA synthetase
LKLISPQTGAGGQGEQRFAQRYGSRVIFTQYRCHHPWFRVFEKAGFEHALKPASEQLRLLRPAGMACEQAMFEATDGVNTHKGGIFSLG